MTTNVQATHTVRDEFLVSVDGYGVCVDKDGQFRCYADHRDTRTDPSSTSEFRAPTYEAAHKAGVEMAVKLGGQRRVVVAKHTVVSAGQVTT